MRNLLSLLPNFRKNKSETNHTDTEESQVVIPKYLRFLNHDLIKNDPENYSLSDDGWFKKAYVDAAGILKYSEHGSFIHHITIDGFEIYADLNRPILPTLVFQLETMGMPGQLVIKQSLDKERVFHTAHITPATIFYTPIYDDDYNDNQLKTRNPKLYMLKEGGFLRDQNIPFYEMERNQSDHKTYFFVKPSVWMRVDLPEYEFEKVLSILPRNEESFYELGVDFRIDLSKRETTDVETLWVSRKSALIEFELERLNFKNRWENSHSELLR
jgi:hypothetical protein